jgi:hypothetical protein
VIVPSAGPKLSFLTILIPRYGITLKPWISWTPEAAPLWWNACNRVKHHRDTRFKDANLGNALNAVAALFSLTIYHYALETRYRANPLASDRGRKVLLNRLQPQAQLFQLRSWLGDVAETLGDLDVQ